MIRGVGAALTAAVLALSGCASSSGEEATTAQTPDAPVNPWDLPLEERPDLFDPCAEIPIEAIEEGVGSPVENDARLRIDKPGKLQSCGWSNEEVIFNVLSTWKSRDEYLDDRMFKAHERSVADRSGLRLLDTTAPSSCQQAFFTSSGTILVSTDLVHGLSAFRGENFADPCEVLETIIGPNLHLLPTGEF